MEKKWKQAIRACELFQAITDAQIENLNAFMMQYKRGDVISDFINQKPCVGIIAKGKADVYTSEEELSQPNVSTQETGSIFGICNVYLPHDMPTRLVCKVACEVVFIPKDSFKNLVEEDEVFRKRYLTLCNQKIIYLAQKIELMGIAQSRVRIEYYLLTNMDNENKVVLKTSKEQFAKFLSLSRATLFRILSKMEQEGAIQITGNEIKILHIEKRRKQ